MRCGTCKHIHFVKGQQYHDCREDSPRVVVSGFKPNPAVEGAQIGKIMTVWPRVSVEEKGCGRYAHNPAAEKSATGGDSSTQQ